MLVLELPYRENMFPNKKKNYKIQFTKLLGLLKGYINHCDKLRGALQEFI